MARYATGTEVSVEKSKSEIEKVLIRYGANSFGYGWDEESSAAAIHFRIANRVVRMVLPLPRQADHERSPAGRQRTPEAARAAWEQACRSSWRALLLIVKAKLEAVESGISTLEREFLADLVLPNNRTVGQFLQPQIEEVYRTGQMPPQLPGLPDRPLLSAKAE